MPWIGVISVALLFVGGVAFVAALFLGHSVRTDMRQRVDLVAGPRTEPVETTVVERLKMRAKGADALVRNIFAAGMERRWGLTTGAPKLLLIAGATAALAWIVIIAGVGAAWWLALPIAMGAAFVPPRILLAREQRHADRQFMDLFPDAIDTMVRMLRAGLPITAGIRFVGNTALPPVNTVFAAIADQAQLGVPVDEALEAAGRQVALTDFRFFVVAVSLQRATGGNLAATLESLSDIIRKRRAVRLKAKAASAEIRVSAYVLGSIPILMGGLLFIVQPAYIAPLFTDPRGQVILGSAVVMLLIGFGAMWQMMRGVTTG